MALNQNIDRRGRVARAISGGVTIAAGIALWVAHWPDATVWRVGLSLALGLAGLFQLFEARRGWCVMRACGFRTPM